MTLRKLFCLLRHKQYCGACVAVRQLLDQGCQFGFFEPDFEILAFFEGLWLFSEIKNSQTESIFFSVGEAWLWKNIVRAAYSLQISSEKSL